MRCLGGGVSVQLLWRLVTLLALASSSLVAAGQRRDASAISFLNQAVTAAGGRAAVSAIQDYTAQGTITHYWDSTEQGQLTIKSRGLSQFRIDSLLPEGTWSNVINGTLGQTALPDGTTYPVARHNLLNDGASSLPILKVNAALLDQTESVVDMGVVNFGSGQARQIEIQQNFQSDPTGTLSKLSRQVYFFDPSTFLILRVQYMVHPDDDAVNGAIKSILDFGNYQNANGISVPFSIRQAIAGQQTWSMQLTAIAFNTGLSDPDFQF